jgi:hypothetical protein
MERHQLIFADPLRRVFRRVFDVLDYFLMLARLRILDALAGPVWFSTDTG